MAYNTNDIQGFYRQYLGRDLENPGEAQGWLQNPDAERMIRESGEGQAYATKQQDSVTNPWTGEIQDLTDWNRRRNTAPVVATMPMKDVPEAGSNLPVFTGDYQAYFNQLFPGANVTPQQLKAREADLNRVGITLHKSTSGDNIRLPDGRLVDVIGDAGPTSASKNIREWQVEGSSGGGVGQGGGGFGSGTTGSSAGGYSTTGQRDDLYNMLLARAKQGLNVSQTDPNIRQQTDPYAAQVEREKRLYLDQVAERQGPLANLQGETRLASERAGQAVGLFESQLVGRELQSRRDEIAQALQEMRGMLSQEQQLAMQRELAQLDASIRNRQISSGQEQFMADLGLRAENQGSYWDWTRSGG